MTATAAPQPATPSEVETAYRALCALDGSGTFWSDFAAAGTLRRVVLVKGALDVRLAVARAVVERVEDTQN